MNEELTKQEIKLIIGLLPKSPPPEGLDPTFYFTLSYKGDIYLQEKFDSIAEKLKRMEVE